MGWLERFDMGLFGVILPAAGRSTRFGAADEKKIYADLDGLAVWQRAVAPFVSHPAVGQVVLAIAAEDAERFEASYGDFARAHRIDVIHGGDERHETVALALGHLGASIEHVAVHDAARPCVTTAVIDAVFAAAREAGAVFPGLPVTDTLRRLEPATGRTETVSRADLYAVQTPQAFRRDWLEAAYAERAALSAAITDDAQLVEAMGHPCRIVAGSRWNLKITRREDLELARLFLSRAGERGSIAT